MRRHFEPLQPEGVSLRGRGALWCVELAEPFDLPQALAAIRAAGILVTSTGRSIRLLPGALMPEALLDQACAGIAAACLAARRGAEDGS